MCRLSRNKKKQKKLNAYTVAQFNTRRKIKKTTTTTKNTARRTTAA